METGTNPKPEILKRGTKYVPAVSGREKVPVTIRTAPFEWNNYNKNDRLLIVVSYGYYWFLKICNIC